MHFDVNVIMYVLLGVQGSYLGPEAGQVGCHHGFVNGSQVRGPDDDVR